MTAAPEPAAAHQPGPFARVRARILSGLFVVLPFVVTVWIVLFLFDLFRSLVLDPIVQGLLYLRGEEAYMAMPAWWRTYASPVLATFLVLGLLYLLGLFVRSRVYHLVNALILRVPLVTTIYQAVLGLVESLQTQRSARFQRVVLVEFPQPGMRSLAIVTNTLRDAHTGNTILCVVVLTGVVPPAGFTLFVPEEAVTDIAWTVNQTLQAIVSGGITSPPTIGYFPPAAPRPAASGPPAPPG